MKCLLYYSVRSQIKSVSENRHLRVARKDQRKEERLSWLPNSSQSSLAQYTQRQQMMPRTGSCRIEMRLPVLKTIFSFFSDRILFHWNDRTGKVSTGNLSGEALEKLFQEQDKKTGNLATLLPLLPVMPVRYSQNIAVELAISNGADGVLVGVDFS